MKIFTRDFGVLSSGETAHLYTLMQDNSMSVSITDFGGAIVSLLAPDRRGRLADVVLGYEHVADYEEADGYLGALVGRYANRIAGNSFTLDGNTYGGLHVNDGPNHLHGGRCGLSKVLWQATAFADADRAILTLTYHSPDGDEGYPGNLDVTVTYTLTKDNSLSLHYAATTDCACPLNLTNHVYFNLAGNASGSVLGQTAQLDVESYCRTNADLIPTGELVPVSGTPFDFTAEKPIGRDFFADYADLRLAGGYDHCLNFTDWRQAKSGGPVIERGYVSDPVSGRTLVLSTNQPCIQFYTANFLKNPLYPLRGGYTQKTQHGFCLETQKMPDSPHHVGDSDFTDCILRPGETYDYTTVFRFTCN